MQRKLMAVAVAGVFAAPALVFAQSSTVQLYGRITYEYGYADQGDGKPSTDIAQTPGGTAIGFRGQEKLGGGLTAWFQCESSADVRGINQDGLCTRNSAIGFKGGWGNLHFGRWDSPLKRAVNMGTVGVKDTGLLGHSFVFAGGSGGTNAIAKSNRNRWKRRDVGWTYYESPKFSGAQILAAFTPGNAATAAIDGQNNDKPRVLSIAGTWKHGPFAAGIGYESHDNFGALGAASKSKDDAWGISGAYTFANKVEFGVAYLDAKYEQPDGDIKKQNWLIGVDWAIAGPHSVQFGWVNAGKSKGSSVTSISDITANAGAGGTGADWWTISYEYAFSKRTKARIGYVALNNDQNASYTLGGTKVTGPDQDQSAFVLYLQHNF